MKRHRYCANLIVGLTFLLALAPLGLHRPIALAASALAPETATLSFAAPPPNSYIDALAVYNGKLYAGTCCESRIYVYDGTSWSPLFQADNGTGHVHSLIVYQGKLYAGTNYYDGGNLGRVWVYDGATWAISRDAVNDSTVQHFHAFGIYDDTLYAGTGDSGRIWSFDGTTWAETYDTGQNAIWALTSYNGKLYAASGSGGNLYALDGATWSLSHTFPDGTIKSLATYNGKLYAGGSNGGEIYVYDGTSWAVSFASGEIRVNALTVFNNRLYAGTGPDGRLYAFDGANWTLSQDLPENNLSALAVYNDQLYIGTNPHSSPTTAGNIYALRPADTSAPTITITSPTDGASYLLGQAIAADYACADEAGGSGLAACTGPVENGAAIDTASVGLKTFTVNATDNASNSARLSHVYRVAYVFSGFYQPIDNNQPNQAKAGKTIPIKWRLTDASGLPISDPHSFDSVTSSPTASSCSGAPDMIETYAGTSGLQYLGDGYWQFNWKTSSAYARQCRTMSLNLSDGVTGRTATFIFQ